MPLSAKEILRAVDREVRPVAVPEWGENATVLVGTMGALARAEILDWIEEHGQVPEPADEEVVSCDTPQPSEPAEPSQKQYTRTEDMQLVLRWCIACILDPKTQRPAFTLEQLEQLGAKSPGPLMRIFQVAQELNLATLESRAVVEKNSEGTPGDDSGGE